MHQVPYHRAPANISDRIARGFVKTALVFANAFFRRRYGHRAIVLETVAAVPGMVGGLFQHLKCLRRFRDDHGWIRTLVNEAENERMHLMVYVHITKPTYLERLVIILAQGIFFAIYFLLYLVSSRTAHRTVAYLEEEAVHSYTVYLEQVETGEVPNPPAPDIAKRYWNLSDDARLREVIIATRKDEMIHRDVNHEFADKLNGKHAEHVRMLPEETAAQ
ncbi:MAG: oxidase [Candidatus Yonathbacteria bacterium RIFOXYC1_FULL_52_10]|uniref:Oxidase n=1 Tax=Candidatus Yonathbacteria bacterium RIFOXYD1_FULL_52_36 TaxID=1802730 RepID=A0A1G2SJS4_9BACT|nr:MAG: oxidase [Candidatus Yonathbacteria bacterium RIFOXYC1_FULL_52_10]OHA84938.1 MAG: oxidase [Candidatus Yonathbacteria bacterium RIFOXYD1_FULL_52_36]